MTLDEYLDIAIGPPVDSHVSRAYAPSDVRTFEPMPLRDPRAARREHDREVESYLRGLIDDGVDIADIVLQRDVVSAGFVMTFRTRVWVAPRKGAKVRITEAYAARLTAGGCAPEYVTAARKGGDVDGVQIGEHKLGIAITLDEPPNYGEGEIGTSRFACALEDVEVVR